MIIINNENPWLELNNENIYNYLDKDIINLINKSTKPQLPNFDLIKHITNPDESNKSAIKYDIETNTKYIFIYRNQRYLYIITITNSNIIKIKIYLRSKKYYDLSNNIFCNAGIDYLGIDYKNLSKSKSVYLNYIRLTRKISRTNYIVSFYSNKIHNIYKKEFVKDYFKYKTFYICYKNYYIYIKTDLYTEGSKILTKINYIKLLFN